MSIKDKRKKGEVTAKVAERLFKTAGSISGAAFLMSLPIDKIMQRYPALCKKYGGKKKKINGAVVIDNRLIKSVYKGLEDASGEWKVKEVKLFTEKRFVSLVMNNEKIIVSVSFNLVEDELIEANKDKDIVIAKLSEQIKLMVARQLARGIKK